MKYYISTAAWAVVFIFICGICACRSQRQVAGVIGRNCFPVIAAMPDSVLCIPNRDSTYFLCQDKKVIKAHALYPQRFNRILILRCEDSDTVFNEAIPGGTARWADTDDVEIFSPSGIPRDSRATTYHFNVRSGKKTYLDLNKE